MIMNSPSLTNNELGEECPVTTDCSLSDSNSAGKQSVTYKLLLLILPLFIWIFIFILVLYLGNTHLNKDSDLSDKIYMIVDETGPEVFINTPFENRFTEHLQAYTKKACDSQLILNDGEDVVVRYHEDIYSVKSKHETIDNLLRRMEIVPSPNDMIAINITGDSLIIHIDTRLSFQHEEITNTKYSTKIFSNPLLEKGERITIQNGVNGAKIDTYNDVYELGQIVETTLLDSKDSSSVAEIIEYGTLVKEVARDDIIAEVHPFHNKSGGYIVFASGDTMSYSKVTTCNATAYYGGYSTATGHPVGVGVIAVDPKVFPYGTRMFIQTPSGSWVYGIGTAWDCGGAVKGNIIDLWFETIEECTKWGRRDVTCYILN